MTDLSYTDHIENSYQLIYLHIYEKKINISNGYYKYFKLLKNKLTSMNDLKKIHKFNCLKFCEIIVKKYYYL